eukprot:TRINITY_DN994_c0_g5_i3.p1 TRINITY_DN994_c0_g5~~TRINITY_DN994_c0_g5_i3.p1  ORF type:complete len:330 (+),score=97.39 TRINITY_DN994_c0_g5_i3:44-991(+)
MAEAARLEEAAKHIKSAQKKLKKSLTKWSIGQSDYDVAALEYEMAAKIYQHLKRWEEALGAWENAADNHGKADNHFCKGRAYDAMATIHKENKNVSEVARYTQLAGKCYLEDGKPDKYSEALVRAARLLRETQPIEAAKLVEEALATLAEEEQFHLMPEPGRLLVAIHVKAGNYLEAVKSIKSNLKHFKALNQQHNIDKGCIEIVVLHIARKDAVMAERDFKDVASLFEVTGEENLTCQDLVTAVQSNDSELMSEVLGRQIFTFLHPDIARLTKKLAGTMGPKKPSQTATDESPNAADPMPAVGDGDGDDLNDWM